jgi:hypothetical protein
MKTMYARFAGTAGALALAMLLAPSSGAQCMGAPLPQSVPQNNNQQTTGHARLIRAAYDHDDFDVNKPNAVIIGMWHVKLTARSVSGAPIPVGTEIDAGFQQWHSDGTEMLNSGRPAANSNFCMGVWEQVGPRTFKLNHFAISYTQGPAPDAQSGPTNTLVGPTSIVEEVTVSANGNTYTGTFTITDYKEIDTSHGNSLSWQDTISGTITGTRIDATTPVSPIF